TPSERQLESLRKLEAAGQRRELLLDRALGLAGRVVERRGDEILEHVLVVADQVRLDLDAAHLVLARHAHLDHAAARLAFDLGRCKLLLSLLDIGLHLLSLSHQLAQAFHESLFHCLTVRVAAQPLRRRNRFNRCRSAAESYPPRAPRRTPPARPARSDPAPSPRAPGACARSRSRV